MMTMLMMMKVTTTATTATTPGGPPRGPGGGGGAGEEGEGGEAQLADGERDGGGAGATGREGAGSLRRGGSQGERGRGSAGEGHLRHGQEHLRFPTRWQRLEDGAAARAAEDPDRRGHWRAGSGGPGDGGGVSNRDVPEGRHRRTHGDGRARGAGE